MATIEQLIQRIEILEKTVAILSGNTDKPVETQKSKKPKKEKKSDSEDEEKPKAKRTSGYILFSNATRDEVRTALQDDQDEKPKNTEIMKELAKRWKELSEEDKEPWNAKAKELKEEKP
tara:strand:+ start:480 stop:836 length:357 start_codon:yes stop_codon:yes gene_type:complete